MTAETGDQANGARDGANTRATILSSAAALFKERGYGAVPIRDIAAAAGISPSTLYHHFKDKRGILFAISERFMLDFNREMWEMAESPGPPSERLRAVVRGHLVFQHRRRGEMLTGQHFRRVLEPDQRQRILALMREYRDIVGGLVQAGIDEGEFVGVEASFVVPCILDMANGVREWFSSDGPLTIEELSDLYADTALRMCGADSVS